MAGLVRALQDRSLGVEGRLKVACYLWSQRATQDSVHMSATLEKWACGEICTAYSKKARVTPSASTCQGLWKLLSVLIHTHSERQDGVQLSVNPHLIQALSEVFSTAVASPEAADVSSCAESALECLEGLLNLPTLPAVFYKYELMVSLLLSLLRLVLTSLDGEGGSRSLALHALQGLLSHYTYLQGIQGNHKKVFTTTCGHLLEPVLILLWRLLAAHAKPSVDSTEVKVHDHLKNIVNILFSREHRTGLTSALSPAPSGSHGDQKNVGKGRAPPTSYTKQLFQALARLLEPKQCDTHRAVVACVPILFESFLSQNSEEKVVPRTVEFQFFSGLLQLLGCSCDEPDPGDSAIAGMTEGRTEAREGETEREKEEEEEEGEGEGEGEGGSDEQGGGGVEETAASRAQLGVSWSSVLERTTTKGSERPITDDSEGRSPMDVPILEAVGKCLALLLKYGVYQVAEDASQGAKQSLQLQQLSVKLLEGLSATSAKLTFSLFATFLRLNHKLLEPLLPGLWMLSFVTSTNDRFTQSCVEVYSRLRQLPVLMENILGALRLLGDLNPRACLSPAFPPSTEHCLCTHLSELPPGQCLDILDLLHQRFQDVCLQRLRTVCQDGGRRKKRRRSEGSGTTPADCGALVPVVLKFVDVFGTVLFWLPRDTWRGRLAERASSLLQTIFRDDCLPFVELCPSLLPAIRTSLCSASLLLLCKYCELWVCLQTRSCDSTEQIEWITGISWQQTSSKETLIPSSWGPIGDEEELEPVALYLLKEMIILQLRFGVFGNEMVSGENLVDMAMRHTACVPTTPDTRWTGQVLDIREENYPIAAWSLVLSHLPALYRLCTKQHLSHISSFVLHTFLLPAPTEGGGVTTGTSEEEGGAEEGSEAGVTLRGVSAELLDSEAFQEMPALHEALLRTCFAHSASALPKGYSSELREVLGWAGSGEVGECESTLSSILQRCMEEGHSDIQLVATPRRRRRSERWIQQVAAYVKLLGAIPLSTITATIIRRVLVVMVTWLITLMSYFHSVPHSAQQATDTPTAATLHPILTDLLYLTSMVLHSIATGLHLPAARGRKKTESPSLPVGQLLTWIHREAKSVMETVAGTQTEDEMVVMETVAGTQTEDEMVVMETVAGTQTEDEMVSTGFLAASLATVEMAFCVALRQATIPMEFITKVSDDIKSADTEGRGRHKLHLSVECLRAMVGISCKVCSESPHKATGTVREGVEHLLLELVQTLESVKQRKDRVPGDGHISLLSALVDLLRHRPELASPRVVALLHSFHEHTFQSEHLPVSVRNDHLSIAHQLQKTFVVLDLLSLPAVLSSSDTIAMETDEDESRPQPHIPGLSIPSSWQHLQSLAGCFLEQIGCHYWHRTLQLSPKSLGMCVQPSSPSVRGDQRETVVVDALGRKLNETMRLLLEAANREEIATVFKHLSQLDSQGPLQACVFCWCWSAVLDSNLPQDNRRELRKCLTKTLLKCKAIATLHYSDTAAVTMAIRLATRLVAIPTKIGLDGRSVIISLHLCSSLTHMDSLQQEDVVDMVESVCQLVSTVVRNHTAVATNSPAPLFSSVNKLLRTVISQGQELEKAAQGEDGVSSSLLHCANQVSRLMELFSWQKPFSKFCPYTIGEFTIGTHRSPVHRKVKQALLPGFFSLLRQCSEQDVAFIQASLPPTTKETFQALLTDYHNFYKFSQRV